MLPFLCIPPRAEPENACLAGFAECELHTEEIQRLQLCDGRVALQVGAEGAQLVHVQLLGLAEVSHRKSRARVPGLPIRVTSPPKKDLW